MLLQFPEKQEIFLSLEIDIVDEERIKKAMNEILHHFQSIDMVVNNTGFRQIGILE